ncbi:hypothetical protein [Acidisoma sp. 7E03]
MRRAFFRPMLLGASLAAPLLLAGCGGDEGVPQSFPPLRYNYLAPISLNVANIQTVVRYAPAPGGSSLDSMSPESPLQAVQQMIQDRLVPGGSGGTAVVTINAASLNQVNDTAVGNISLRLTVTSADGRQRGFTDASVTRTRTMPDNTSPDALRAFLYAMTQDLVNAENVELEYQIRQNLPSWLVGGGSAVIGGPAAPTPVQATPLGGPGTTSIAPATGVVTPMTAAPAATGTGVVTPMDTATPTMPGGALGLPEGNPVPTGQDFSTPATTTPGAPTPLTPAMPATTGTAAPASTAPGVLGTMPVSSGSSASPAVTPAVPATTTTTTKTTAPAAASSSSSSNSALPPLPAGITP